MLLLARFTYTAVVMVAVVYLLRTGRPLGGLVMVPLMAIWLRQEAESGRLAQRARRVFGRLG